MSSYEFNSAEERYQHGSSDLVLANKLGIIDEQEMEALESGCRMNNCLSKASRLQRWLLSTSEGANGWGMCTTGQEGYVTLIQNESL